jgi:AraC-like DNA-binding protein
MQAAESVEEFLAAPIGRFVAGHSFVVWVHSSTLAGSVYFGRPDERDVPALTQMALLAHHPMFRPPFDVVVDVGALEGLSLDDFRRLTEHLQLAMTFAPRVRRVSVVRPAGMIGATVAGLFYEVVRAHFFCGLFTDRAEAFRWLGSDEAAGGRAAIEQVLAQVHGTPPPLRELREWLSAHLDEAHLARAARDLGYSMRSLQRKLADSGVVFRDEVQRARVRAAEALLSEGDAKLDAIARKVGCSSPSQLATMFRRATGESPAEFRTRRLAQS